MDASTLFIYAIELIAAGCAATFLIADSLPLRADESPKSAAAPSGGATQAAGRSVCKHSTGP
ncbi:hypothetical protein GALL_271280 [mine drainage metagenome]|uniref:Uncharacterized protein n=1 Tax=mine drainage metagenome TaxID=410659 RepID=A0A1J5RFV9_9ZZZZ